VRYEYNILAIYFKATTSHEYKLKYLKYVIIETSFQYYIGNNNIH